MCHIDIYLQKSMCINTQVRSLQGHALIENTVPLTNCLCFGFYSFTSCWPLLLTFLVSISFFPLSHLSESYFVSRLPAHAFSLWTLHFSFVDSPRLSRIPSLLSSFLVNKPSPADLLIPGDSIEDFG